MTTDNANWIHGKITDEAVAVLRGRIGSKGPMSPPSDPYSRDMIHRYLASIGDDNPLWFDESYAAKSRWGGVIAPPRFLVCGSPGDATTDMQPPEEPDDPLQGVFAMVSGTRMVFHHPVRLGDRLRAQTEAHDVVERKSSMAGRSLELVNKTTYYNQHDEEVAVVYASVIRMEREAARSNRKYLDLPEARYSADEMDAIYRQLESEAAQRRGATPRYWEETAPGEEMITLIKGPLAILDIASYFIGVGWPWYTNRLKHLHLNAHPAQRLVNVESNIEENWVAAHWDGYFASLSGIPRPYDEGPMRYDALAHLVTDWMGDDAQLRELYVTLRAPNLIGDVSYCSGCVRDKRVEDGHHLVDLDLWITNQREQRTTFGSAVVELPTIS